MSFQLPLFGRQKLIFFYEDECLSEDLGGNEEAFPLQDFEMIFIEKKFILTLFLILNSFFENIDSKFFLQ